MHRARRQTAFAAMALLAGLVMTAGLAASLPTEARAQQAGANLNRDCQTLRTCNFTRNGQPRGCLSTYTCRSCKFMPVKCNIAGRTVCREMVCSWGG